jgi:hypothetical protein
MKSDLTSVPAAPYCPGYEVQAGVAVHLARKRGEEVPPALLAIDEAGADAARELRGTLSVLRSQDAYGGADCDGSGLSQPQRRLNAADSPLCRCPLDPG